MSWSVAAAARGKHGDPHGGDDAFQVDLQPDRIILVVADGAGSARLSGKGAKVACAAFCRCADAAWAKVRLAAAISGTALAEETGLTLDSVGRDILHEVRADVEALAAQENVPLMELASTLVGAVIRENEAFFFQLGDGAAVVRVGEDYETVIEPPETEFLNTTYFVTSPDADQHVRLRVFEAPIQEVALFSDGLQGMVQHPGTHVPHATFFQTVFRTLRQPGLDDPSREWLVNMLGSDMVTSRTDDDTSIVIAKRLETA